MLDLQTFVIPDNTRIEEHTIVIDGGVLIGGYSGIEYGIIAELIAAGEHVGISGEVSSRSDVRIDRWSEIHGTVHADGDVHIGEFTKIHGKLVVAGDLDIGDHVSIDDGFEAMGWITIKNPIPVIIFLYMYLSEMLRLGRVEEAEKALEGLFSDDCDEIEIQMMVMPVKSEITLSMIVTDGPMIIGDNCRLQGNVRANSLSMGDGTTMFGGIKAGSVTIGENNIVHGSVDSKGDVHIGEGSHILGDVRARAIKIHHSVVVGGTMDAPRGIVVEEAEEPAEPEHVAKIGAEKDISEKGSETRSVGRSARKSPGLRRKNDHRRAKLSRSRKHKHTPGGMHERKYYIRRRGRKRN